MKTPEWAFVDGRVLVQPDKSRWAVVRCPSCGDTRNVSARQAYRKETGETTGLCRRCRNPPRMFEDENDPRLERLRVWWLEQAGIRDMEGLDARSYVRVHGCPAMLCEIAKAIDDLPVSE
jgi:hypothetical protein